MGGEVDLPAPLQDQGLKDEQLLFSFWDSRVHHLNKPARKLSHRTDAPRANCLYTRVFYQHTATPQFSAALHDQLWLTLVWRFTCNTQSKHAIKLGAVFSLCLLIYCFSLISSYVSLLGLRPCSQDTRPQTTERYLSTWCCRSTVVRLVWWSCSASLIMWGS